MERAPNPHQPQRLESCLIFMSILKRTITTPALLLELLIPSLPKEDIARGKEFSQFAFLSHKLEYLVLHIC